MKGLVRIREIAPSEAALLSPAQSFFLRENLSCRLLAVRVALLARDEASYRRAHGHQISYRRRGSGKYFDAQGARERERARDPEAARREPGVDHPPDNQREPRRGALRAGREREAVGRHAIRDLVRRARRGRGRHRAPPRQSDGYVVVVAAPYRVELSLNLLVVLVFAGYFAFHLLARLVETLVATRRACAPTARNARAPARARR